MARKLDESQLREFAAFLQTLYDLAGFPSDAEWARRSGVHTVNLSNARTGKGQLDGFNLLLLLRAAAERVGIPLEQLGILTARLEAAVDDPTREILRRLHELEGMVAEGLTRLAEGESPAAEQSPDEAPQDQ